MIPLLPTDLTLFDELWMEHALERNPDVTDLKTLVSGVIMGRYQAWRLDDGLVLAELVDDRVYVVLVAGKNVIRNFPAVFGAVARFGAEHGKHWIAGRVFRKGLLEKYMRNFGAVGVDGHVQALIPPDTGEGLRADLKVQTPAGVRKLSELSVGDKVLGPKGEQTIVDKAPSLAKLVSSRGLAHKTHVWVDGAWQCEDRLHQMDLTEELLVTITVLPDHEFLLDDGTVVHNLGGPKTPAQTTTNTTTTATPWAPLEGYFEGLGQDANAIYNRNQNAGNNAFQNAYGSMGRAAQGAQQGGNAMQNLAMQTARGDFLGGNPHLANAISAALNPIQDRYQQQVLPGISSAAQQQGAFGGSRQAILENQGTQMMGREMADAASRIAYGDYSQERNYQNNAGQLLGQASALQQMPGQIYSQMGQMQTQQPWMGINQYANILNSMQGFGTTSAQGTNTNQQAGASGMQGLLGGAASGASIGANFGPWGAGIGGVIGGLGGLFG